MYFANLSRYQNRYLFTGAQQEISLIPIEAVGDVTEAAATLVLTGSQPAPTKIVTKEPSALTAQFVLPAPTINISSGVTFNAPVLSLSAVQPAPGKLVIKSLSQLNLVSSQPAPSKLIVKPLGVLSATASAQAPSVLLGGSPVTVVVSALTAALAQPAPTIAITQPTIGDPWGPFDVALYKKLQKQLKKRKEDERKQTQPRKKLARVVDKLSIEDAGRIVQELARSTDRELSRREISRRLAEWEAQGKALQGLRDLVALLEQQSRARAIFAQAVEAERLRIAALTEQIEAVARDKQKRRADEELLLLLLSEI